MKKRKAAYYLGNILILLSLTGFIYTIYPILQIYLFPVPSPAKSEIISDGFFISIPRIHAYSEVIPNVDPWNEKIYNSALKKGVAHARGTYLPGEDKNIFLFAHSSGAPWEITHTNTIFLRLSELEKDDYIYLDYAKKRYGFKVISKKEINPSETQYLTNFKDNKLILQTCSPIGTSLKRLLIFAEPLD